MARIKKGTDADKSAIIAIVKRGLASGPDIPTKELQRRAAEQINSGLGRIDVRVFNGRYVLPLRRRIARPGRPKGSASAGRTLRRASAAPGGGRDPRSAIRAVLLDLAQTVAG